MNATNATMPEPHAMGGPVRTLRQPLGLPAGSVRAILALMILGLVWTLMLLPEKTGGIPLYLFYLMFLILGHFFAAHGHSIAGPATGHRHPLYLPRGTLRTLIVLGFVAVLARRYFIVGSVEGLFKLQQPLLDQPSLPIVLVAAFFVGVFVSRVLTRLMVRDGVVSPWWQDIQAWIALLATIGLTIEVLIQLVINPSLDPDARIQVPHLQMSLAALVCFYFGARS